MGSLLGTLSTRDKASRISARMASRRSPDTVWKYMITPNCHIISFMRVSSKEEATTQAATSDLTRLVTLGLQKFFAKKKMSRRLIRPVVGSMASVLVLLGLCCQKYILVDLAYRAIVSLRVPKGVRSSSTTAVVARLTIPSATVPSFVNCLTKASTTG